MTKQKQIAKFHATVLQNLPEIDKETMQKWIEKPWNLQVALIGALWEPEIFIRVWTGQKIIVDEFANKAMNEGRRMVGKNVLSMMRHKKFVFLNKREGLGLVKIKPSQLGLSGRSFALSAFYEYAKSLGLSICPPEVGLRLAIQYADQPVDEVAYLAMEPIAGKVFYLDNCSKDGMSIQTEPVNSKSTVFVDDIFIFVYTGKEVLKNLYK